MKAKLQALDWASLELLLDSWFGAELNRQSSLPFDSSQHSWNSALLAASLFKRGAFELRCTESGEVRSLAAHGFSPQILRTATPTRVFNRIEDLTAASFFSDPCTFILCDTNVLKCHPKFEQYLKEMRVPYLQIECTELNKSLHTARHIFAAIPEAVTRLIVVGGGLCCDMGGFVGGLRGCEIHLVPTTLLAAVDAGLGGKTGVNHPRAGKNQIGLFVALESVSVVTEFLTSLRPAQVHEGIGEILKHAFLAGTFDRWQPKIAALQTQAETSVVDWNEYQTLLQENLEFKNQIVSHDPFEKNIRALLNYGHTIAHLIEALTITSFQKNETQIHLSHGCAVALGQLFFLRLGWARTAPEGYAEALLALLKKEGIELPLYPLRDVETSARNLLLQDKKNTHEASSGLVRCVTPNYGCLGKIQSDQANALAALVADNTTLIDVDNLLIQLRNAGLFS
ncbi:MAG: hypothetical protein RI932_202 [Pseudomonadota bacterium]|jgi:3-dehydroquinate synthase